MKKVTKIVTLVSTGLCALALVPAYLATVSAVQAQADNDAHAITFVADEGVTVTVPTVARAGSVVDVTLSYDALTYEVNGILVNGNQMAAYRAVGDSFYFIMPDADAEVVVYGNGVNNGEEHVVHNVQQDKGVILNYTTPTAKAGDYVYFNVGFTTTSAYTWTGKSYIYSLGANGVHEEVDGYEYLADYDTYAFIMPDADVYIDLELEAKGYLANFDSVDNVDKIEVSNDNGSSWKKVDGEKSFLIRAFDKVKVTLKDTLKRKANGITVGEEAHMVEEGGHEVVFDMPAKNCEVKVNVEDILYALNVTDDEKTNNYTFKFFRCDTSSGTYTETTAGACYGQYVRVYPTAKEGVTGKKVYTLQYSYDTSKSYSWTNASKNVDDDGNTYYQFYMTYGQAYSIRVSEEATAQPVAVTNTAHITGTFVHKVNGEWVENTEGFFTGDYVYAKIVAEDGYKVADPKVAYKYSSTSTSKYSTSMSKVSGEDNIYRTTSAITNTSYCNFEICWTEDAPKNITFAEDELVTFDVVKEVNNEWVDASEDKYYKGDNIYVRANFTGSAEDYVWNGITVSAGTLYNQDTANKIYRIYLNTDAADITIGASYKSLSAYKNHAFVGSFVGANFYHNHFTFGTLSSYNATINGSGSGTFAGSSFEIYSLSDGSNANVGMSTSVKIGTTTNNGKGFVYGGSFIATPYSASGDVTIVTDFKLLVKVQETGDAGSIYSAEGFDSFSSNTGSTSNTGYAFASIYRSGTLYKSFFIDKSTGTNKFYFENVRFTDESGDAVDPDESGYFNVYSGETLLGAWEYGDFIPAE